MESLKMDVLDAIYQYIDDRNRYGVLCCAMAGAATHDSRRR